MGVDNDKFEVVGQVSEDVPASFVVSEVDEHPTIYCNRFAVQMLDLGAKISFGEFRKGGKEVRVGTSILLSYPDALDLSVLLKKLIDANVSFETSGATKD